VFEDVGYNFEEVCVVGHNNTSTLS
jgi:hypothetical protein